ncbi:MAG: hypothetical protein RI917_740, partial [Actinomycetota bacterium]
MTQSAPVNQRRVSPVSVAVGILAAILFALLSAAGIYTDWLWFDQLGYETVFINQIVGQVIAFAVGFVIMATVIAVGLMLAWRTRPIYLRMPEESPFQAYQQLLEGLRKVVMFGVPALVGIGGGLIAAREWQTAALFLNGEDFGTTDAHFGLDVGFYVFDLPFFTFSV